MLRRCSAAERLFQLARYISADEYSFSIGHLFLGSPCESNPTLSEKRFGLPGCERPPQSMTRIKKKHCSRDICQAK
jgi:hypothetical protein